MVKTLGTWMKTHWLTRCTLTNRFHLGLVLIPQPLWVHAFVVIMRLWSVEFSMNVASDLARYQNWWLTVAIKLTGHFYIKNATQWSENNKNKILNTDNDALALVRRFPVTRLEYISIYPSQIRLFNSDLLCENESFDIMKRREFVSGATWTKIGIFQNIMERRGTHARFIQHNFKYHVRTVLRSPICWPC